MKFDSIYIIDAGIIVIVILGFLGYITPNEEPEEIIRIDDSDVGFYDNTFDSLRWESDGTKLYVDNADRYTCSTNWDVTTCTYDG